MNEKEFEKLALDSKESQFLIPQQIESKNEYYYDLNYIVNSWSGRTDVLYSNKFFIESQTLITNAIVLFEKGYFDCSFYSLRQSIEVSLTISFLADIQDSNEQNKLHSDWKEKKYFPMRSGMVKQMDNRKLNFADIKDKMSHFFEDLERVNIRINKYIHKQGYDTFYSFRSKDKLIELKNDFLSFLEMSISAVALHRLVIDPLPILLMDENIYEKSGDMLTEPFSDDFVKKYLGRYIDEFKETDLYKDYYNYFDAKEKYFPSVLDLVKNQFFDREKIAEIQSQVHLLGIYERLAMCYFLASHKTSQIHFGDLGMIWYFSNVKTKRSSSGFNSESLKIAKKSNTPFNNNYNGVYLSFIKVDEYELYLEHNEKFIEDEIELHLDLKTQFEEAILKANREIDKIVSKDSSK